MDSMLFEKSSDRLTESRQILSTFKRYVSRVKYLSQIRTKDRHALETAVNKPDLLYADVEIVRDFLGDSSVPIVR